MCEPGHFKLCTCGAEELEQLGPNELIWTLIRSDGPILSRRGSVRRPSSELPHTITSAWFEKQLNQGNCFDFEYSPQKWDMLRVQFVKEDVEEGSRPSHMGFVYHDGAWNKDRRLSPRHQLHLRSRGKVQFPNGIPEEAVPLPPETKDQMLQRIADQGAILRPFSLELTNLPADLASSEVIWKISRYKGRSLNPNHGRGLSDIEARLLSGPCMEMLEGGWHVEWLWLQLVEENCFGFDYVPKHSDQLRIIVGYGTPQAMHLAFNFNNGWYPQPRSVFPEWKTKQDPGFAEWYQQRQREAFLDNPDPRVIRDVIYEGRVISK